MAHVGYHARRVAVTKGLEHIASLRALRTELEYTQLADFASAVEYIAEEPLLRALWEAGLNDDRQKVVLRRLEELKARRE